MQVVGALLLALTIQAPETVPRVEGVGGWDITMVLDPGTAKRTLAVTSSGSIVQVTRGGSPTLIGATDHDCLAKPLFIRIDQNKSIMLGEKGRRNVDFAFKQMLVGKKAVIAYYQRPCESVQYVDVDLQGFAETLEKLKKLPSEELDAMAASIVTEWQKAEQAVEQENQRLAPGRALSSAARDGNMVQVIALLDQGADVNSLTESNGYTPLLWASARGHTETVHTLLDAGADVNIQAKDGQTALLRASNNGHLEIVRLLLEAGADVNAVTEHGVTALRLATLMRHTEIIELLQQAGAKE